MENVGYSIVVRVYSQKNVLMGIKCDGVDESMRGSSIKVYSTIEDAIEVMTQKIWAMRSSIKL